MTKKAIAVGEDAFYKYFNLSDDRKRNTYYFSLLKHLLNPKNKMRDAISPINFPDDENEQMKLDEVIGKFLYKVRLKVIEDINFLENRYGENDIKWVLTVPAIWDIYSKEIMKKVAILDEDNERGLTTSENIEIALEPEAVALTMKLDKGIINDYKSPGQIYF